MTNLEKLYLEAILEEAYGGTIFAADINPKGMDKKQKSGVASSLAQKGYLVSDDEFGQIGIIPADETEDAIFEISKQDVKDLIARVA